MLILEISIYWLILQILNLMLSIHIRWISVLVLFDFGYFSSLFLQSYRYQSKLFHSDDYYWSLVVLVYIKYLIIYAFHHFLHLDLL